MRKAYQYYISHLNAFMLLAIVGGAALGFFAPILSQDTSLVGTLFLRLLQVLIVPVIVFSMLAGILNLGSSANLGRLGLKTIIYYATTTAIAVLTGLILVNIIQPGKQDRSTETPQLIQAESEPKAEVEGGITDVIERIIPKNVIQAASEGNVLGLIFFSVFIGIALLSITHPGVNYIKDSISALFQATIWMVDKVMIVAPIGILSLVATLVAQYTQQGDLEKLGSSIGWYSVTVLLGLFIHALISLPLIAFLFGVNPLRLLRLCSRRFQLHFLQHLLPQLYQLQLIRLKNVLEFPTALQVL